MMKKELFNNETEAMPYQRQPKQLGLYDSANEHDACGVGMLVNINGNKSHDLVESALKVLENMSSFASIICTPVQNWPVQCSMIGVDM